MAAWRYALFVQRARGGYTILNGDVVPPDQILHLIDGPLPDPGSLII
jgi:hypothetical protein